MVADMSYTTVSNVIDSWEQVRRTDNYEEVVGTKLFVKYVLLRLIHLSFFSSLCLFLYLIAHSFPASQHDRFFALEPEAKSIFGFRDNQSEEQLIKSRRFLKHASYFIQMIDKALGMLGPDIELLTEILLELGKKHVVYGGTC
jgi:hypothetical protein